MVAFDKKGDVGVSCAPKRFGAFQKETRGTGGGKKILFRETPDFDPYQSLVALTPCLGVEEAGYPRKLDACSFEVRF